MLKPTSVQIFGYHVLCAVKEREILSVSEVPTVTYTVAYKVGPVHLEFHFSGQSSNFKWQRSTNDSNSMAISANPQITNQFHMC